MKWVKATERLPLHNQTVVTRDNKNMVHEYTYFEGLKESWELLMNEWLDESDGWISINDRDNPPPKNTDFLVLFDSGYIRRYLEKKQPFDLYTHWQPLPKNNNS